VYEIAAYFAAQKKTAPAQPKVAPKRRALPVRIGDPCQLIRQEIADPIPIDASVWLPAAPHCIEAVERALLPSRLLRGR